MGDVEGWTAAVAQWGAGSGAALPRIVLLAVAGALLVRLGRRDAGRHGVLAVALVLGAALAWRDLSLVDDAHVSFRYAENLLDGRGLVWNPGERVLGITNLLWTLLLAAGAGLTGADLPYVALVLGGLAWLAFVLSVEALGRSLPDPPVIGAASLLAVHHVVTSFASTGLETVAAAAAVTGAGVALVRAETPRGALLAGGLFAVAALVRLDHGLFWALALLALPPRLWTALVAPGVAILAELGWSWATYGDPLPNTFHAKAVLGWRPDAGATYALVFWLGSHGLALAALAGAGAWLGRSEPERRLVRWVVPALVGWHLYLLAIGGDFMYGRFLVVALPLVLLLAERGLAAARGTWAPAAGALLLATAGGVSMMDGFERRWLQVDEGALYRLTSVRPIEMDHHLFRTGHEMRRLLTDRGVEPILAAYGIGMVGYFSRLPLVDLHGLTDREIATAPLGDRDRVPGHEKHGSHEYMARRGVQLSALPPHPDFVEVTRLRVPGDPRSELRGWHLYRYDPALVARLREVVPEIEVVDANRWVQRQVAQGVTPEEAARLLAFLDAWYFPDNPRPKLRERIEAAAR